MKDHSNSVANTFARLQTGTTVRAVVDGSVYYRGWKQWFSRKPLTKETFAHWADFKYYTKKGKIKYSAIHYFDSKEWFYG